MKKNVSTWYDAIKSPRLFNETRRSTAINKIWKILEIL